jgi:hypothetical protein
MIVNGLVRRKIFGRHFPLAPGFDHIEDGIDNGPPGVLALGPTRISRAVNGSIQPHCSSVKSEAYRPACVHHPGDLKLF